MRLVMGIVALGSILLAGLGAAQGTPAKRHYKIAAIPKSLDNVFWTVGVHTGVEAARDLATADVSLELVWTGPESEANLQYQIDLVRGLGKNGFDGLVLAPSDRKALVAPVEEARRQEIPTVIIDSPLASDAIVSFVGTDNARAGALVADELARLVGETGKVILLRHLQGSASTLDREEGFLERVRSAHPDLRLLSSDEYAGPTAESARVAAAGLLARHGAEAQALFTTSESATRGALRALQEGGLAGKVALVGFDSAPDFITAMRQGQIHGLVLQDPFKIGYEGVKAVVQHLLGRPVSRRIDTGVMLLTADRMHDPEARRLLRQGVR